MSIPLSDALCELRKEIEKAQAAGECHALKFAVKSIEVELSVGFEMNAEAHIGASKWIPIVDVDAAGQARRETLHKVRLELTIESSGSAVSNLISDQGGPKPKRD